MLKVLQVMRRIAAADCKDVMFERLQRRVGLLDRDNTVSKQAKCECVGQFGTFEADGYEDCGGTM